MTLQEGIYWDSGQTPGRCAAFLFLRAPAGAAASAVGQTLRDVFVALRKLQGGAVPDLPGTALPKAFGFTALVGYGVKAFRLAGAKRPAPAPLVPFKSPLAGGGGPLLRGSGLRYASGVERNPATEEVLLQFIGDTPLSVNLPVVETWKVLDDAAKATGESPLAISAVFNGFNREDKRSWVDFHDGISNIPSGSDREKVIVCEVADTSADAWLNGGTYLAFMRLRVDLGAWRRIPRHLQEELVGRDKISGCALVGGSREAGWTKAVGCPFAGTVDITEPGNAAFQEPDGQPQGAIIQSHVRRANHGRTNFQDPDSNSIYRQGYEFLDGVAPGSVPDAGLNFVSFQDTPKRLIDMLTMDTWLEKVNFGGDPANPIPGSENLLSVLGAGLYAVPPAGAAGEAFPGESIFV